MTTPPEDGRHPDFYIVGAAKAGTTSLWNYLQGHPEIHLGPVKEPNFFSFGPEGPNVTGPAPPGVLRARLHIDSVTNDADYRALFRDASPGQVTGEASVRYLYAPQAATRIATHRPDARIVILLRDPIDRLRSHFTMNRSWGLEPLDLPAALAAEDERVAAGWEWDWHYVRVGLHAEQVERYFDVFGSEQVLILRYDDFRRDPVSVVRTVCAHVGVDTGYSPDTTVRSKEAYLPRSRALDALRSPGSPLRAAGRLLPRGVVRRAGSWLRRANHRAVDPLPDQVRHDLVARFEADQVRLASLVGWSPSRNGTAS